MRGDEEDEGQLEIETLRRALADTELHADVLRERTGVGDMLALAAFESVGVPVSDAVKVASVP